MEKQDPVRIVIRVSRAGESGEEITEERAVECPPDKLLETLAMPWAPAAPVDEPGPGLQRMRDAIGNALSDLQLTVVERRTEAGDRAWTVGFRPPGEEAPDGAEPDESVGKRWSVVQPSETGSPAKVSHRASAVVATDNGDVQPSHTLQGHRLTVMNQGLSVANWGNCYMILDMHIDMHLPAS